MDAMSMEMAGLAPQGDFSPRELAARLKTTLDELAGSIGLGRDALARRDRIAAPRTQMRLRQLVEILNRLTPRLGSELVAYAWYRSQVLPGFEGRTCMHLVQEGRAEEVLEYLDAVDAGVHA
jgi:hypothetical protein